jgi:hypothetical protein
LKRFFSRIYSSNNQDVLFSDNGEIAFSAFKTHMVEVFKTYGKDKVKIQQYCDKMDVFLKNKFCIFYKNSSQEIQGLLLSSKNYKQYSEILYFSYASYLKTLDNETGGRPELDNTPFRCLHHIIPKFAGGGETAENRCHIHQYEHALIHLFRFSWTPQTNDLNAFSSACLTKDQMERRNYSQTKGSIQARKKTTQNPEWQATQGRKGLLNRRPPIVSPLQRRANSLTGTKNQYGNSRKRANPFTWWLCEQELCFRFVSTGEIVCIKPNPDPKKRTVANIAEQLLGIAINTTTNVNRNTYSNLSVIFRAERREKWGWSFHSIKINEETYLIQNTDDLKRLEIALATLFVYLESPTLSLENLESQFVKKFIFVGFTSSLVYFSMIDFINFYATIVSLDDETVKQTLAPLKKKAVELE